MTQATLLYDSECSMCSRFKKGIELLDRNNLLEYKSIYDPEVYVRYPQLRQEDCEAEIHLVDPEGNVFRGGEVMSFLVKLFPGADKFAWLLDSESSKRAFDSFYDRLNNIRNLNRDGCPKCKKKGGQSK